MLTDAELLEWIRAVVSVGNFRIRSHATRHMFKEGILERDMIEAVTGKSRILEHYPDEEWKKEWHQKDREETRHTSINGTPML